MQHVLNRVATAIVVLVVINVAPSVAQAQSPNKYAVRADALVKDYVQNKLFSGTVLVAQDGKPIFRKGFGAASREWAIPNTANTKFRIGSVTKEFTAAAVLRLVDEQKLSLDDPIEKYLQNIPASWGKATIRELLQHTSGIPSYTRHDDFDDKLIRIKHTPQQIIDLMKDKPLDFEPGTKFRYSNTGYFLLGRVIEAVSGLSYPDYLEQKLLKPLNLTNTGYDDGRRILANFAQDYTDHGDHVRRSSPVDMSNMYAAGAMYATVDDLLAWQQMLLNGKVLSSASTAAMFTDAGHHYGLGWFVRERFSRKVYEHGGALKGFHSMLAYYPEDRLTVIVLSNYGEGLVDKIADELARLALGVPPARRQVKVDSHLYSRFIGSYQLAPNMVLTVARKGDRLFARVAGQKELEIYPEGQYSYFYKAADAALTFDRTGSGKADYVILHQDNNQIKAPRIN